MCAMIFMVFLILTKKNVILSNVIEVIKDYLSRNRRLVVPQLGAFIVKEPDGVVVFSELLKRDDGVLREELMRGRGMSGLEAAGAIDRFVFEVRHALQHTDGYRLHGFGHLNLSPSGAILFQYDPARVDEQAVAENSGFYDEETRDETIEEIQAAPESILEPEPISQDAPNVSPSVKLNPEPYVKGLQYGRPQKNTQGFSYVGAKPRRRVDLFVVIATIVALLATAAIVYGYYRSSRLEKAERDQIVQPVSPEPSQQPAPVPVP